MIRYIAKRIAALVPILIGVSIITFILVHIVPVDPALVYLRISDITPTDKMVLEIRSELGLDKPMYMQYFSWIYNVLHLDFGKSFITKKPVLEEIFRYFPATLELTIVSIMIMITVSIPIGILTAVYKDSKFDRIIRIITFTGSSMPNYWLALLLIYIFSFKLNLFPIQGKGGVEHIVLPSITLALGHVSTYIRLLRTNMLENLNKNYVFYAKARGLKQRIIIGKHVFKNALSSIITALGVTFGHAIAGSVIVENIFGWPGMGRFIISSIFSRDYPVIQCYVLIMAVVFVFSNLIVDIINYILDPRLMKEGNIK